MPKPTAIVIWFDDNTRYHIDPSFMKSMFMNAGAAAQCGHPGPFNKPPVPGPVAGPFADSAGPPRANGATAADTTVEGTCYLVNGVIVCP